MCVHVFITFDKILSVVLSLDKNFLLCLLNRKKSKVSIYSYLHNPLLFSIYNFTHSSCFCRYLPYLQSCVLPYLLQTYWMLQLLWYYSSSSQDKQHKHTILINVLMVNMFKFVSWRMFSKVNILLNISWNQRIINYYFELKITI